MIQTCKKYAIFQLKLHENQYSEWSSAYRNAILIVTKETIASAVFQINSLKTLKQMKDEALTKLSSNNNDITTDVKYIERICY